MPEALGRHLRRSCPDACSTPVLCTTDRPTDQPCCSDLLARHKKKFHPDGPNSAPPPPKYSRQPKPAAAPAAGGVVDGPSGGGGAKGKARAADASAAEGVAQLSLSDNPVNGYPHPDDDGALLANGLRRGSYAGLTTSGGPFGAGGPAGTSYTFGSLPAHEGSTVIDGSGGGGKPYLQGGYTGTVNYPAFGQPQPPLPAALPHQQHVPQPSYQAYDRRFSLPGQLTYAPYAQQPPANPYQQQEQQQQAAYLARQTYALHPQQQQLLQQQAYGQTTLPPDASSSSSLYALGPPPPLTVAAGSSRGSSASSSEYGAASGGGSGGSLDLSGRHQQQLRLGRPPGATAGSGSRPYASSSSSTTNGGALAPPPSLASISTSAVAAAAAAGGSGGGGGLTDSPVGVSPAESGSTAFTSRSARSVGSQQQQQPQQQTSSSAEPMAPSSHAQQQQQQVWFQQPAGPSYGASPQQQRHQQQQQQQQPFSLDQAAYVPHLLIGTNHQAAAAADESSPIDQVYYPDGNGGGADSGLSVGQLGGNGSGDAEQGGTRSPLALAGWSGLDWTFVRGL